MEKDFPRVQNFARLKRLEDLTEWERLLFSVLNLIKSVLLWYMYVYLTIIPRARMGSVRPRANWAIDSEAMRARGINCFSKIQLLYVVGQKYRDKTTFSWLKLDVNSFLPPKLRRSSLLVGYTLFFFIRMLFFRPGLNILSFLPILGWKNSCIILIL